MSRSLNMVRRGLFAIVTGVLLAVALLFVAKYIDGRFLSPKYVNDEAADPRENMYGTPHDGDFYDALEMILDRRYKEALQRTVQWLEAEPDNFDAWLTHAAASYYLGECRGPLDDAYHASRLDGITEKDNEDALVLLFEIAQTPGCQEAFEEFKKESLEEPDIEDGMYSEPVA